MYADTLRYILYYDIANLVTVTKMNMIRQNALGLYRNHCCENMAPSLLQCYTAVSAALENSCRAAQHYKILLYYKSNLIA